MSNRSESFASKTSIAPMLSVRRGAKAIEFYKSAFGASELFRLDSEDGAIVARLSAQGAEFWVADESPEHKNFSPESLGGGSVRMVMIVEDPDAAFDRAVSSRSHRGSLGQQPVRLAFGKNRRSLRTSLGNRQASIPVATGNNKGRPQPPQSQPNLPQSIFTPFT
jgi:uncharacterized glyoxalase superfamily protein PhnB